MKRFSIGQRWISEMEPELGLGIIKQIDKRVIGIRFPASVCERQYAISSAPLKRVEFKAGDVIKSRNGQSFTIRSVSASNGLFVYHGDDIRLIESDLCDFTSFTTPQDRLITGFIESNQDFNLRYRSLLYQHKTRKSSIRGFIGGRVDLIPHQLYVAHEVASRHIPRVLLSDETGLGKTIEVCLILHRLLINSKINRVLIVVPHSLVHQWFVELLRRFNLVFRLFDQKYCESIKSTDSDTNPFLEDQLGICSIDFLTSDEKWTRRAVEAGWDMLVIDEAHHLTEKSPAYHIAKKLGAVSNGLMLLTATPEQLGHKSHFARLRLLDPARYFDFNLFEKEEKQYQKISDIINTLLEDGKRIDRDKKILAGMSTTKVMGTGQKSFDSLEIDEIVRQQLIEDLLDRHGVGRAVFRNTRATMTGFPKRVARLIPMEGSVNDLEHQTTEFLADQDSNRNEIRYDFTNDPRIIWLAHFLRKRKDEKVLLICRSVEKVRAIEDGLRKRIKINIAQFHENLNLLQRDKNAAWFAKEHGAQILLCSEIGSEGRNFQFSHHLVLFDLPLEPELLEQRIGRLDRIGQKQTIYIHIPYIIGSEYEILTQWYHKGLNAFEKNVSGIYQIFQKMGAEIKEVTSDRQSSQLRKLIRQTQTQSRDIAEKLKKGRDRLLELNSFRSKIAQGLIQEINSVDKENDLEKFMLDIFHLYGIRVDTVSDRTYKLDLLLLSNPEFPLPAFKQEKLTVTFDRKTAISHEDIEFLTWDHPMVIGILDLILGSEKGNCTIAIWPNTDAQEILLEAIFVLECVAPKHLNIDRFLPPTPIRVVLNHLLKECGDKYSPDLLAKHLKNTSEMDILDNPRVKQELLPKMLKKCKELAESKVPDIINNSSCKMENTLTKEVIRLAELKKVNNNIKEEEIQHYEREIESLRGAIGSARLRLDALRLIYRG